MVAGWLRLLLSQAGWHAETGGQRNIKRMSRHPPDPCISSGRSTDHPPSTGRRGGSSGSDSGELHARPWRPRRHGPQRLARARRFARALNGGCGPAREWGVTAVTASPTRCRCLTDWAHTAIHRVNCCVPLAFPRNALLGELVRVCSATKNVPRTLTPTHGAPLCTYASYTSCTLRVSPTTSRRQLPCVRTVLKHRVHRMHSASPAKLCSFVRSQRFPRASHAQPVLDASRTHTLSHTRRATFALGGG